MKYILLTFLLLVCLCSCGGDDNENTASENAQPSFSDGTSGDAASEKNMTDDSSMQTQATAENEIETDTQEPSEKEEIPAQITQDPNMPSGTENGSDAPFSDEDAVSGDVSETGDSFVPDEDDNVLYMTETAQVRTIEERISVTGTLVPAESVVVSFEQSGSVELDYFEKGDTVKAGDVLYVVGSPDGAARLSEIELAISDARAELENAIKLRDILSECSLVEGNVDKLFINEGDTVSEGDIIADVSDTGCMLTDLYFLEEYASQMNTGDSIRLYVDGSDDVLNAVIVSKSDTVTVNEYGAAVIKICASTDYVQGLLGSESVFGEYSEGIVCASLGTFYHDILHIRAGCTGVVQEIYIKPGDHILEGQSILLYSSEDAENRVQSAVLALEQAQDNYNHVCEELENNMVKAPIDGTVVEKFYAAKDTVEDSDGMHIAAIIYDLSSLQFTFGVPELDISSVKEGQRVYFSAEENADVTYIGEVMQVSSDPITEGDETTYPVTVSINDEKALSELKVGSNVVGEAELLHLENALSVSTRAVEKGNIVYVCVDTADADTVMRGEYLCKAVKVELGATTDEYVQILSGINEGDVIVLPYPDDRLQLLDGSTSDADVQE